MKITNGNKKITSVPPQDIQDLINYPKEQQ